MKSKTIFSLMAFFALIGIVISVYMTYAHYNTADFCPIELTAENKCDVVNQSRFSEILGIPVPAIGVGGYLALFLCALLKLKKTGLFKELNFYMFGMAVTGFGFTVYLNYIEFFVLKTVCYICCASAAAITFIFVLSILGLGKE